MAEWLKAQALVETTVAAPVSSASFANPGFGLGNHLEAVLVDIRLRFPGIQENLCVAPENTIAALAIFLAI